MQYGEMRGVSPAQPIRASWGGSETGGAEIPALTRRRRRCLRLAISRDSRPARHCPAVLLAIPMRFCGLWTLVEPTRTGATPSSRAAPAPCGAPSARAGNNSQIRISKFRSWCSWVFLYSNREFPFRSDQIESKWMRSEPPASSRRLGPANWVGSCQCAHPRTLNQMILTARN